MKMFVSNLRKTLCAVFGHRFRVANQVTPHISEYKCKCCKCELTTNENGRLDKLTPELKEVNRTLADFYRKRHTLRTAV